MARREHEQYWVAKRDMRLGEGKVNVGQLVKPSGDRNDQKIFGDNTHWTYRYDGGEPIVCGTDGCSALFNNLGSLDRHRKLAHAPERDERDRARLEAQRQAKRAEDRGDTVAGHEVVAEKRGPGGAVPYIAPLS